MQTSIDQLKKGEKAIIVNFNIETIPLKLVELGCMVGHLVELKQIAPMGDPLFLDLNGTQLAIRKEMAKDIIVEIIQN